MILRVIFLFLSMYMFLYATPKTRGDILASDKKPIFLNPLGGYVDKVKDIGTKGLEQQYNYILSSGDDVLTYIDRGLQQDIDTLVLKAKEKLDATEVMVMVMESSSGKMLTLSSSNRYDDSNITMKDIKYTKPNFASYMYEPGAVLMPFSVATMLYKYKNNPDRYKQSYDTNFTTLKIGKHYHIKDDTIYKKQTPKDMLVHSSNVGMALLVQDINGSFFYDALHLYGFDEKSGIDLPNDKKGYIKTKEQLQHQLYRTINSYGYGIRLTPMQLLKAYAIFANDGVVFRPYIATIAPKESKEVLPPFIAKHIKDMLISVVQQGTGVNAQVKGIIVGGKTGTAHIAKHGRYIKSYNSSFFGFAQDKQGDNYTIGVVVVEPKEPNNYFASKSAVPIFKQVVKSMISHRLLKPDTNSTKEYMSPLAKAVITKPYGVSNDKEFDIKVINKTLILKPLKPDSKVVSIADGKVVFAGLSKDLGNVVIIYHKDKVHSVYANLSKISPQIKTGIILKQGQTIGTIKDKLILQMIKDSQAVNPAEFIEFKYGD